MAEIGNWVKILILPPTSPVTLGYVVWLFWGPISQSLCLAHSVTRINDCIYIMFTTVLVHSSSVQFSCSVTFDSLQPHGLQHARPPCPSPAPMVYSNSCPLSGWCHPIISFSVFPFPPAFNHSQHQCLFSWISSLQQVAKVLEFQLQHQSVHWIFRTDLL